MPCHEALLLWQTQGHKPNHPKAPGQGRFMALVSQYCEEICWKSLTHRIHGAAIYGNIYQQYTPNVSIYTSTMDPMGLYTTHLLGSVVHRSIAWMIAVGPKASPSGLERWAFAHGCPAKQLLKQTLGSFLESSVCQLAKSLFS